MTVDKRKAKLLLTTGEPSGIGPELCLLWLANNDKQKQECKPGLDARMVLVGDIHMLREKAYALQLPIDLIEYDPKSAQAPESMTEVWHTPLKQAVVPGQLNVENAQYVLDTLDIAIRECMEKRFDAVVTGPIHKGIINDAGVPFTGHTEYLAQKAHQDQVVMMLVGNRLRVALVTTHLPLRAVADAITQPLIVEVLRILNHDLRHRFGLIAPKILVAGLNPHAGEDGHLGMEEIDIIKPALQQAKALGIDCEGPFPADTIFLPERLMASDAILAMYHDQGLATLKYASFGQGANITLGLPFIRTSVDHGCALTLAGKGTADAGSLQTAIEQALVMVEAQSRTAG